MLRAYMMASVQQHLYQMSASQPVARGGERAIQVQAAEASEEDCPICMEKLEANVVSTVPCGHLFHEECLKEVSPTKIQPQCDRKNES